MAHGSPNHWHDDEGVTNIIHQEITLGNMKALARKYLNHRTFRNSVQLDSGDVYDSLELDAAGAQCTVQDAVDEYDRIGTINLERPLPEVIPIVINQLFNDSYIIPSRRLDIRPLARHPPRYRLEAILCSVNNRQVIFLKNLSSENDDYWYYFQESHECERLSQRLSENLEDIFATQSRHDQRDQIERAHFMISPIFYNAQKYIYHSVETR